MRHMVFALFNDPAEVGPTLEALAAELEEGNVLLSVATPSDEAAEHVTALLEAHGARVAPRRHERRERE